MTTAPEVRAEARTFLPWLVAAPLIGIASWIYDGIFIGAADDRARCGAAMSGSWQSISPALVVLVPTFGNHGLWAALMVLNTARGRHAIPRPAGDRGARWPRRA